MSVQFLPDNAALMVIDVQKAWDDPAWGPRNNPTAEYHIEQLLAHWRERQRPVIIVEHHSLSSQSLLSPDQPGVELQPLAMPHPTDHHVIKHVNSAFIGTGLDGWLKERGIATVVVTGFTTVHCCSTTIRMAGNLGYQVYAVEDAMATFDTVTSHGHVIPAATMHAVELAALDREFCTVTETRTIIEGRAASEEF